MYTMGDMQIDAKSGGLGGTRILNLENENYLSKKSKLGNTQVFKM